MHEFYLVPERNGGLLRVKMRQYRDGFAAARQLVRWRHVFDDVSLFSYWDAPGSEYSYCLATSPDLEHWTNRSAELTLPVRHMRHGTVLRVPAVIIPELQEN